MGLALSKDRHDEGDRVLVVGRPNLNRCDNMIVTSKYTAWSFLPVVSKSVKLISLGCMRFYVGDATMDHCDAVARSIHLFVSNNCVLSFC
jgi:hypothetical protein